MMSPSQTRAVRHSVAVAPATSPHNRTTTPTPTVPGVGAEQHPKADHENRSEPANPLLTSAREFAPQLATGHVQHHRRKPREHQFEKKIRMVHYDVDRPESVLDLPLWASDWPAPMQVRDTDHLNGDDAPQGPAIRRLVQQRLGFWPAGPISLLTQPRTWGWLFNPISIYFVWEEHGTELVALVLEVTNTPWHERHQYVVDARGAGQGVAPKELHVSPFMPMNQAYHFTWQTPEDRVTFGITVKQEEEVVFAASLHLRQEPLSRAKALRVALSRPWATVAVSLGIHVQALRLWLKGIKFHRNPRKGLPDAQPDAGRLLRKSRSPRR
ncbi:MAG: DUF1365 domain-containing protein [Actinomycetia bacterium]|nr:DUF1365 domain-containing protein [Actinomycetes bacterium]